MNDSTTLPRPHCTRCGRYLYAQPNNAYGWCEACELAARYAGLPYAPAPAPLPIGTWPYPYPYPWPPGTIVTWNSDTPLPLNSAVSSRWTTARDS